MREKKRRLFRQQLRTAFIIVIMIPVLCLGGFIFYSSYRHVNQQRQTECSNMVSQNMANLENWAQQCNSALRYLAGNFTLQEFLRMDVGNYVEINRKMKEINALLYNILLNNQNYKNITIYTENSYYADTNLIKNSRDVRGEEWYQQIISTNDIYWWSVDGEFYMGRKIVQSYPADILGIVVVQLRGDALESNFHMFREMPVWVGFESGDSLVYEYEGVPETKAWRFEEERTLEDTGWKISYKIGNSYFRQNVLVNLGLPMLVIGLVLFLAWILIRAASRYLMRDLSVLLTEVNEVQNGNFDVELMPSSTEEIHVLIQSIQGMLNKIKQLIRQVYAKEIERQELELNLLQSKISPHFLYNNLSAINWMALDCGEDRISMIATEMASFYRTALNKGKNIGCLSVEIANIKAYINLQLIAHEDGFDVEYDIDGRLLKCAVPIFVLQPLVENAIEHGIELLEDARGRILVQVRQEEGYVYLEVYDNGRALYERIGEAVLPEDQYGYGTSNVHKRIRLLYGSQYGLTIKAGPKGTVSSIKLNVEDLKPPA